MQLLEMVISLIYWEENPESCRRLTLLISKGGQWLRREMGRWIHGSVNMDIL